MLTETKKQAPQPDKDMPYPVLDKRFLVSLKGKDFVTYAGLLDLAHQHGLVRLEVEAVQFPCADNGMACICRAMAETDSGKIFTDIGDANPKNTTNMVSAHIIRMASTRAKARVLRDITNIGITALEELGDDTDGVSGDLRGHKPARLKPVNGGNTGISDAQKRAIWTLGVKAGHDESTLSRLSDKMFGCGIPALSNKDAAALINHLQESAA